MLRSVVVLLCSSVSFAQTAPGKLEFEVASIKPAAPAQPGQWKSTGLMRGGPGTADPSQVRFINTTLVRLVLAAYDVKPYQFTPPDWMNDAHYDVEAKVPEGATKDDVLKMLQNMLAQRFQMKAHFEKKEMQAYALAESKQGVKMKPAGDSPGAPGPGASIRGGPDAESIHVQIPRATMASLCGFLTNQLSRPVLDETGLMGEYAIDLEFAPEGRADSTSPTIFTAIQERLGLRLDAKKAPVDVLIVDHAEKTPTEN